MHDLVVRDLEQTRNRTLGLTDLDGPTLVTQHDPLMSPLVWTWRTPASILHTRGGVVVAGEPYYDDPGWADVPEHHLVDVADGVVTVTELEA